MSLSCASALFQCILHLPACPGVSLCDTGSPCPPPSRADFPGLWLASFSWVPACLWPPSSALSSLGLVLSLLTISSFSVSFPRSLLSEPFSLWCLPPPLFSAGSPRLQTVIPCAAPLSQPEFLLLFSLSHLCLPSLLTSLKPVLLPGSLSPHPTALSSLLSLGVHHLDSNPGSLTD